MEDTHVHALDYLSVLRRRKWWLIAPIIASIAVGLLLVRYLPKQYRSSATVAVVASGVSTNLVGQSAPLDNEERLRAVSQQLLSASTLARVAREEQLGEPDDKMIGRLRSAVTITVPEPVASTNEPRRFDSFIMSYADATPERAQRIADRLASVFVDESSKTREQRAEHTSTFIATQLAASRIRMAELEATLRRAKESHIGQLPEQTQANLQTLSGLRQQMDANATTLRGEQDRLTMIERQLEGLKQGATDLAIAPRAGGAANDLSATPESRVVLLQRELATARLSYTERHPEIVRLTDELATARKEALADHQRPASDRMAQLQTEPAYRQLVADREIARLRINELSHADTDIRRQIAIYQARVESAPMVEQQLVAVQRDNDLEKQQYADLSAKLHAANMAESVERARRGEQFAVLYPAAYPSDPIKPVPLRVMLLSIVGGICLGAALTLGREYLDRSVHNVRELRDELDLPVLGEVARIQPV